MKKYLLLLVPFFAFSYSSYSQELYSSTHQFGSRYNPGLGENGTPKIIFDDISISNTLVEASDSISITKVKVGIRRLENAPATNVNIYYSTYNDTATIYNSLMKTPVVYLGTVSLPANGNNPVTKVVSLGDSVTTLFRIKTEANSLHTGYQTFFLGVSFSNDDNANSIRFTTGPSINEDFIWIYNADSTVKSFAGNFEGTAVATFYMEVFGKAFSTLPVKLGKFYGERQPGKNLLTWTTETELNNKGFELQRSADGTNFTPLAFIDSKAQNGTSSSTITYNFSDVKRFAGDAYYRFRQLDKDGNSVVSNVVFIKGDKANQLKVSTIYPNPSKSTLNLVLTSPVDEKVNIVIADLEGRILLQQSSRLTAGNSNISFNVSKWATGTYIIKAISVVTGETAASKFIKQ